jgi:hypothetical protein
MHQLEFHPPWYKPKRKNFKELRQQRLLLLLLLLQLAGDHTHRNHNDHDRSDVPSVRMVDMTKNYLLLIMRWMARTMTHHNDEITITILHQVGKVVEIGMNLDDGVMVVPPVVLVVILTVVVTIMTMDPLLLLLVVVITTGMTDIIMIDIMMIEDMHPIVLVVTMMIDIILAIIPGIIPVIIIIVDIIPIATKTSDGLVSIDGVGVEVPVDDIVGIALLLPVVVAVVTAATGVAEVAVVVTTVGVLLHLCHLVTKKSMNCTRTLVTQNVLFFYVSLRRRP